MRAARPSVAPIPAGAVTARWILATVSAMTITDAPPRWDLTPIFTASTIGPSPTRSKVCSPRSIGCWRSTTSSIRHRTAPDHR
jgi:hypothetical protein